MVVKNKEIRLVLVGKNGSGKSSLGNNLLGRKEFKSTSLQSSTTLKPECRRGSTQLTDGTNLVVVDTPGIADTKTSITEIFEELIRCIELSNRGPHVFLIVLKIGYRFTQKEVDTIKYLKYWFGQDFMKYAVFIFTGKDSLDYGSTIDQHLANGPFEIKALIREAGGRVAAINNRFPGSELEAIMNLVKQTMQINHGQHYTQHLYSQAVIARKGQPTLVENDRFKDVKDLRIREMLQEKTRLDTKDQVETNQSYITKLVTDAWNYLSRPITYIRDLFST